MSTANVLEQLKSLDAVGRRGRVTRLSATAIESDGPAVPLGTLCEVEGIGGIRFTTEVIAVRKDAVVLANLTGGAATFFGAAVAASSTGRASPVGDELLGRVTDALGEPLDGRPLTPRTYAPLDARPTPALDRTTPANRLNTGIRAIDGLLTLGQGQRVGVFAPSGGGKTTLMTQLAEQVEVDRCVICLVGERGREVENLWSSGLSARARQRTAVVAATSDQTAAFRVRAVLQALALCDYWRAQGHQVLLLLDSATRLAMALRELGLAAGEPPTTRGYTPNVFSVMPQIVERCGALKSGGSITAIMTVLAETEDVDDPISEMMKSLLDGHIILSRELGAQGQYPAIDLPRSISRLASSLRTPEESEVARQLSGILSQYDASRILIESGVYLAGTDPSLDRAIRARPLIFDFLRQGVSECSPPDATRAGLSALVAGANQ